MTLFKSIINPNNPFSIAFLILFFELLSIIGYLTPVLMPIFFVVLALVFLAVSIKDLRYGIYLLLAELLIGSLGHLFYVYIHGNTISIRIMFWFIILAVWIIKKLMGWAKDHKLSFNLRAFKANADLMIFFGFIGLGLLSGFIHQNSFKNIFLDFNGWLYFLLALPMLDGLDERDLKIFNNIFIAAIAWISLKTLFFAYLFAHFSSITLYPLFRWLRDTGTGEITLTPNNFYRIFFQSQIFVLAGIFIVMSAALPRLKNFNWKKNIGLFLLLAISFASILISFSRSFWMGLVGGLVLILALALYSFDWRVALKGLGFTAVAGLAALAITLAFIKFPLPRPITDFNTGDLSDRLGQLDSEAGASSRWALLPPLWNKIKSAPILGQGFGTTLTYKSSDPRVLENNPSGLYTTYAFEWGWLDIWLKLGLFGLIVYLLLIIRLALQALRSLKSPKPEYETYKYFNAGLVIGLLVIAVVSVSSPYLNHPLGIGYILFCLTILFLTQRFNQVEEKDFEFFLKK